MPARPSTRERILDASRRLFNEKGYAATTLAEIADSIGIAQGNLTYHFPTKRELAVEIERRGRRRVRENRERARRGVAADDYVRFLLFSMTFTWEHRFLLRDHAQFAKERARVRADPDMAADLALLRDALRRMTKDGAFRRDVDVDPDVLARSLWIVSRYWMDHLREVEGVEQVSWADQERGVRHHFAVLLPYLSKAARRELEAAVVRVASRAAIAAEDGDEDEDEQD